MDGDHSCMECVRLGFDRELMLLNIEFNYYQFFFNGCSYLHMGGEFHLPNCLLGLMLLMQVLLNVLLTDLFMTR